MLTIIQIILSVLLITVILMQSRGTGLGSAWGGDGKSYHSRRGLEKVLFQATIGLTGVFILISLLPIFGISF